MEEAEKEFPARMDQITIAMANIQAAAQTSKPSGVSPVPVVDGNIARSSIIVP